MKQLLLILTVVLLTACSGVKKTQKAINLGQYSYVINHAVENLANNKTKKSYQPYILLLEESFEKNKQREINQIAFLEEEGNESNYEAIYHSYVNLKDIQERIKPLLPLTIIDENRTANFEFDNYESQIVAYKEDLSEYLFDNAEHLLSNAGTKKEFREAYNEFAHLNKINPRFENTEELMQEAHFKGIDYIEVKLDNNSNQIIPEQLAQELLNFNTFGLNDFWTTYHTVSVEDLAYDYKLELSFDAINVSPEQIHEKEFHKEKAIIDGYTYARDDNGIVLRDSLGVKIKIDKFKTVKCHYNEITQFKSAQVVGSATYFNLQTQQPLNSYPLASEALFEHKFARSKGDIRALEYDLSPLLELTAMPFPSDEQLVYEAGEDLKSNLKQILTTQRFY